MATFGSGPSPGWFADPGGSGAVRWWDGNQWTHAVGPGPSTVPSPMPLAPGYWGGPPGPLGKVRGPGSVILLTIVTLGIYGLVWQYKSFEEMRTHSGQGLGGGVGLLLAIFLSFVNWFALPSEVGSLYAAEGQPRPVSGLTGFWFLLPFLGGIIWLVRTQGALNRYWRAHGAIG